MKETNTVDSADLSKPDAAQASGNQVGKLREVYIGNGQTITVPRGKTMKMLDVNKALDIYLNNITKDVAIGMQSDFFFTGTTIKTVMDIENYHCMASDWDTPIIQVDDEQIPCYIEIDEYLYSLAFNYGFYRGTEKIDFWFRKPKLSETLRTLEYDDLKAMTAELQPILEKYQPKRVSKGMYKLDRPHTKHGKEIQEAIDALTDLVATDLDTNSSPSNPPQEQLNKRSKRVMSKSWTCECCEEKFRKKASLVEHLKDMAMEYHQELQVIEGQLQDLGVKGWPVA